MVTRIGPRKPFRHFISQWMDKRGMSQTDVANKLECGTGTISKLLSGKMELTGKWLAGIAWALDLEVPDLFRDPNQPTQEDLLRDLEPAKRGIVIDMIRGLKKQA